MRIIILAEGTRGDNEPYVVLGKGLIEKGHEVLLCNATLRMNEKELTDVEKSIIKFDNDTIAKEAGVPFLNYGYSKELLDEYNSFLKTEYSPLDFNDNPKKNREKAFGNMLNMCRATRSSRAKLMFEAVKEFRPDVIIQATIYSDALSIGEKLNIPVIRALLWPALPTSEFPLMIDEIYLQNNSWEEAIKQSCDNVKTYSLCVHRWEKDITAINTRRKEIFDLDEISEMELCNVYDQIPSLIAYSPVLLPVAKDWKNTHLCGFWKEVSENNEEYSVSKEVKEFIEAGDAPVYIGFGSCPVDWIGRDARWVTELVLKSLMYSKQRGVVLRGLANIDIKHLSPENTADFEKLSDYARNNILFIDGTSHKWLFPKCKLIIHHGGIGTTTSSILSKTPSLIAPLFFDQPVIAMNLERIKAGKKLPLLSALSPDMLAHAILENISNEEILEGAKLNSKKLTEECKNSVDKAIFMIENLVNNDTWPWSNHNKLTNFNDMTHPNQKG